MINILLLLRNRHRKKLLMKLDEINNFEFGCKIFDEMLMGITWAGRYSKEGMKMLNTQPVSVRPAIVSERLAVRLPRTWNPNLRDISLPVYSQSAELRVLFKDNEMYGSVVAFLALYSVRLQ